MEDMIAEIVESVIDGVFGRNHDEIDQCSMFDFSQMSEKLDFEEFVDGSVLLDGKNKAKTESIVSPEFTAADVFSDLELTVNTGEHKITVEMATQTSQSLLGAFDDAAAQTSQMYLHKDAADVAAQTSQPVLLPAGTSVCGEQDQLPVKTHRWWNISDLEVGNDWVKADERKVMADQVVPQKGRYLL